MVRYEEMTDAERARQADLERTYRIGRKVWADPEKRARMFETMARLDRSPRPTEPLEDFAQRHGVPIEVIQHGVPES
jgi:hypothetical protein